MSDDTIPRSEANAMVAAALMGAASVAQNACLVPPDGGSPTEDEENVCRAAADYILALIDAPADAALAKMLAEARAKGMREAVEIYRGLAEGAPVGAFDGQTFAVRFVTPKEFEAAIRARAAELKGEAR